MDHQKKIYDGKKAQELKFWFDPHPRFFTNMDEEQKSELMTQHFNFTQSNGVALLRLFLISKFPINEDYLRELIDPVFDERNQFDE